MLGLIHCCKIFAAHSTARKTDTRRLYLALKEANLILKQLQEEKQVGVMPNFILALGWLELKTFSAFREIRESRYAESDLDELCYTPWFKEAVEFTFRIHSTSDQAGYLGTSSFEGSNPDVIYEALFRKAVLLISKASHKHQERMMRYFQGRQESLQRRGDEMQQEIRSLEKFKDSLRLEMV